MKMLLALKAIEPNDISHISYDSTSNMLFLMIDGKIKEVPIERSIGTYLKIYKDDTMDFINFEGTYRHIVPKSGKKE